MALTASFGKAAKPNGRLYIPTMMDRAQQALHKLALAPVAETLADPNSYGFREGRSRADADAVQAGFNALSKPNSAPWVLQELLDSRRTELTFSP